MRKRNSQLINQFSYQREKALQNSQSLNKQFHGRIHQQRYNESAQKCSNELLPLIRNAKERRSAELPQLNRPQKYSRPYLENTRFVDTLIKNKLLLRRGQFDIAVKLEELQLMNNKQKQEGSKEDNLHRSGVYKQNIKNREKRKRRRQEQSQLVSKKNSNNLNKFAKMKSCRQKIYKKLLDNTTTHNNNDNNNNNNNNNDQLYNMRKCMNRMIEIDEIYKNIKIYENNWCKSNEWSKKCHLSPK